MNVSGSKGEKWELPRNRGSYSIWQMRNICFLWKLKTTRFALVSSLWHSGAAGLVKTGNHGYRATLSHCPIITVKVIGTPK